MEISSRQEQELAPLPWGAALRCAAVVFVVSRLLVFALTSVPALLQPAATQGVPSDRVVLAFDASAVAAQLQKLARANDAGWYHGVAQEGYDARPFSAQRQSNWAFFPLLPLTWAATMQVFGDGLLAALLVPNAAFFAGLVALNLLCRVSGRDAAQAARVTHLLAFAPASVFFSFPWSESLFFCLATAGLLAAVRRRWCWVAAAGIAASATRFPGLFLLPAALLLARQSGPLRPRSILACLLIPVGAIGFAAHLWLLTGNPLAFVDIQAAWGRSAQLPVRAIGIIALRPWELAIDWNFRWLNLAAVVAVTWAVRHFLKRREFAFAALLVLGLGAPLMTGSLVSMWRYATALFPLAIALADVTFTPARERLCWTIWLPLFSAMTIGFGFGLNFAAA